MSEEQKSHTEFELTPDEAQKLLRRWATIDVSVLTEEDRERVEKREGLVQVRITLQYRPNDRTSPWVLVSKAVRAWGNSTQENLAAISEALQE